MKYIRRIIFIAILILGLASCKKKSNGEIEYKLYENVELGECDEFDISYKIPSHQYVHITFTKNTPWIIYNLNVYEKIDDNKNYLREFVAKTNIFQKDLDALHSIEKYNLWEYNGRDSYLCNGDYYFDIYNDEKVERELGCKLYNSKEAIIHNGSLDICEDLHFVIYDNAFICKLWISPDDYGEKYEVKYNCSENTTIKILDSYGKDVGMEFSRDLDKNNFIYYICIYKNVLLDEPLECNLRIDYAEIYDGYEIEIPNYPTPYSDNYNRFIFNCTESGKYNLISTNSNITIGINEEGFNSIISYSTSRNNISLEKGKSIILKLEMKV